MELVHIPFDAEAEAGATFYRRYSLNGSDRRALLGSRYRSRFLIGGAFDGGTDLLLWLEGGQGDRPVECGQRLGSIDICQRLYVHGYDEAGTRFAFFSREATELALRLYLGGSPGPIVGTTSFGFLELDNAHRDDGDCAGTIPDGGPPPQAWPLAVMKADGRFSVGLSAVRIPLPGDD